MMMSLGRFAGGLGLLVAVGACAEQALVPADDEPGCPAPAERAVPLFPARAQDVLVVVDRTRASTSREATVAAVAHGLASVVEQWRQVAGTGLDDFHLGVVSSDLGADGVPGCAYPGDGGLLREGAACGVDGRFLSVVLHRDGTVDANHAGSLEQTLGCMMSLPPSTCPVTQPLAAAWRAVAFAQDANAGFRRPQAYLNVVIVSDRDDCSLADRTALAGLAGEGAALDALVVTACVQRGVRCEGQPAGPGVHSDCTGVRGGGLEDPQALVDAIELAARPARMRMSAVTSTGAFEIAADGALASTCGGHAWPAPRLRGLERVGLVPAFGDVCTGDVEDAMRGVSETPSWPLVIGCLDGAIDLDPAPGIQPSCHGDLVERAPGGSLAAKEPMARCDDPARDRTRPCYELDADTQACDSGLGFVAFHGSELPAAPLARVRCDQVCE